MTSVVMCRLSTLVLMAPITPTPVCASGQGMVTKTNLALALHPDQVRGWATQRGATDIPEFWTLPNSMQSIRLNT